MWLLSVRLKQSVEKFLYYLNQGHGLYIFSCFSSCAALRAFSDDDCSRDTPLPSVSIAVLAVGRNERSSFSTPAVRPESPSVATVAPLGAAASSAFGCTAEKI